MSTATIILTDLIETERTRMNAEFWQEREDLLEWVREWNDLDEDAPVSSEQIEEYIENYEQNTFEATCYEMGRLNGIALALRTIQQ